MEPDLWNFVRTSNARNVLSIGFGNGEEIRKLSEHMDANARIFGVEINQTIVDNARTSLRGLTQTLVLKVGDATDLPF